MSGGPDEVPDPTIGTVRNLVADKLDGQSHGITRNDLVDTFGADTQAFLKRDPKGWAVRAHGTGIGHKVMDAVGLTRVLEAVSKGDYWISKGLYPGAGGYPGVEMIRAGSSALLHLTAGLKEEPVGEGNNAAYPTVEAGRYLAGLFASSESPDDLERLLAPLGPGAVRGYTNSLAVLADRGINLETVVHGVEPDGRKSDLRRVMLSVDQAVEDLRFLRSEPKMVKSTRTVVGVLGANNAFRQRFELAPDDRSDHISGTYHPDLQPDIDAVHNRVVAAKIRTVQPEYGWLPRARKTSHELLSVERAERKAT